MMEAFFASGFDPGTLLSYIWALVVHCSVVDQEMLLVLCSCLSRFMLKPEDLSVQPLAQGSSGSMFHLGYLYFVYIDFLVFSLVFSLPG